MLRSWAGGNYFRVSGTTQINFQEHSVKQTSAIMENYKDSMQ